MSILKLKDRVESYQNSTDIKLLNKLPVIILINGRGFTKATELLEKPHCYKFSECMLATALKLCAEIEGAVYAYQFNDEIVIVSCNDQSIETTPWFDNKLQKICSVTASMATLYFNIYLKKYDINIVGEPTFTSNVFVVPNIAEAINSIIYKQQQNFYISIQMACFYELLRFNNKNTIKDMLLGLNIDEKIALLKQECNIDFNNYPPLFRRGGSCYRSPKVMPDGTMKNKWVINTDLPIFTKDSHLNNIFKMGHDIFRNY